MSWLENCDQLDKFNDQLKDTIAENMLRNTGKRSGVFVSFEDRGSHHSIGPDATVRIVSVFFEKEGSVIGPHVRIENMTTSQTFVTRYGSAKNYFGYFNFDTMLYRATGMTISSFENKFKEWKVEASEQQDASPKPQDVVVEGERSNNPLFGTW